VSIINISARGCCTAFCAAASFGSREYKSHTSGRKSKDRQIAQGVYEQERAKLKNQGADRQTATRRRAFESKSKNKFISVKI
jgi:hypothetical protein